VGGEVLRSLLVWFKRRELAAMQALREGDVMIAIVWFTLGFVVGVGVAVVGEDVGEWIEKKIGKEKS
jgi:fumarate reductase subunit C